MSSEASTPPRLTIMPIDRSVDASATDTLLQAAAAGGVILPSSCRNGTCRACLCRLRAGEVRYRIEWPGLSAEEKRDGWILPCVAVAAGDVIIEQTAALDASAVPARPYRRRF